MANAPFGFRGVIEEWLLEQADFCPQDVSGGAESLIQELERSGFAIVPSSKVAKRDALARLEPEIARLRQELRRHLVVPWQAEDGAPGEACDGQASGWTFVATCLHETRRGAVIDHRGRIVNPGIQVGPVSVTRGDETFTAPPVKGYEVTEITLDPDGSALVRYVPASRYGSVSPRA